MGLQHGWLITLIFSQKHLAQLTLDQREMAAGAFLLVFVPKIRTGIM